MFVNQILTQPPPPSLFISYLHCASVICRPELYSLCLERRDSMINMFAPWKNPSFYLRGMASPHSLPPRLKRVSRSIIFNSFPQLSPYCANLFHLLLLPNFGLPHFSSQATKKRSGCNFDAGSFQNEVTVKFRFPPRSTRENKLFES